MTSAGAWTKCRPKHNLLLPYFRKECLEFRNVLNVSRPVFLPWCRFQNEQLIWRLVFVLQHSWFYSLWFVRLLVCDGRMLFPTPRWLRCRIPDVAILGWSVFRPNRTLHAREQHDQSWHAPQVVFAFLCQFLKRIRPNCVMISFPPRRVQGVETFNNPR